jgi:hypothetical protein
MNLIPMPVLMGVYMGVLVRVQVLVFMFSLHN